jgi:carbon-monoxide dehydrogenase large subunit
MAQVTQAGISEQRVIGRSYAGLNNPLLVAGKGTFVDDVQLPGMAYAAILRSPYPHARIRSIDTSAAEKLPGVVYVITGEEVREQLEPIPEAYDTAAMGAKQVKWYPLCVDRARYVGEAVAAVVAEDKYTAYEALSYLDVDYEELPAVIDPDEAMKPGAPLVEPDWGDNILITRDFVVGDPDQAFADADGVVSGVVKCNRVTGTPIEPRGCVASYDPYGDFLTFWDSTQDPHPLRVFIAHTLRIPERTVRVIQPHVGGGFGLKQPTFQEEPLIAYLGLKLRRPVKWIEERNENFMAGGHARDTRFNYEAAYKNDGGVTGIKLRVIADVGAPSALCGWGMSFVTWYCLPGVYKIPNVRMQLSSVVTNKCPWNSYRGYGKDAAAFVMDRVIDHVTKATGRDRVEVRFKDFIPREDFPYAQASGAVFDSGNYPAALKKLLEMVDYENFPKLQVEERGKGRYIGLGIGQELTPEGCSMPGSLLLGGYDGTNVRVSPTGEVTVLTGVTSPGSGNETGIAQIVTEALGLNDPMKVKVIQGDTEVCPWGLGNYSSRSILYGGSAAHLAAVEIRERMKKAASSMLEASPEDIEIADERFCVKGAPEHSVSFMEVVGQFYRHPHGEHMYGEHGNVEPALEETRHFKIDNVYHQPQEQGRFSAYPTWPNGASACIVEVNPESGFVKLLRYYLVHDAGKIINPLLADANLHGGIAQGLGGTMFEEIVYDENGQPQTTTLMDYTIPTAMEMPEIELGHQETPSPFTPLGVKGVGESGVGGTLGAIASAIENAFPELDLRLTELPFTPYKVWQAIQDAKARAEG